MVLDILLFTYMAYRYKYLIPDNETTDFVVTTETNPNGIDNAAYKSTE